MPCSRHGRAAAAIYCAACWASRDRAVSAIAASAHGTTTIAATARGNTLAATAADPSQSQGRTKSDTAAAGRPQKSDTAGEGWSPMKPRARAVQRGQGWSHM